MLLVENRALLERYRAGDPDALGQVFEHYHPQVVALVTNGFTFQSGGRSLRFRGYKESADLFDIVHEIFRAAFDARARQSYGGLQPFAGYLFVIARNVIVSRLRREEAAPEVAPLEDADELAASGASPEESAAASQQRAAVARFLETLSAEERAFTRLRFEDDLAQEAVAERMSVGRKKVRLLEAKVRQKLHRFMRHEGFAGAEERERPARASEV